MKFIYLFFFLFSFHAIAQEDILAKEYFKNGEFEKAQVLYKKLHQKNPRNYRVLKQLVKTHQQLEQLDQAQELIEKSILVYPSLLVELGYNYQLKNDLENANLNYKKAISVIDLEVNAAYNIALAFEEHSLLEQAILSYEKGMQIKPEYNFNLQLARIYGEQGDVEKMFYSYVNFVQTNDNYLNTIKRAFSDFISEDKNNPNNIILKKILLKKIQETPDLLFNDLLSWLFIQQKEYYKAFIQEKAIFKRDPISLYRIKNVAVIAADENQDAIAIEIFEYIKEIAQTPGITLEAESSILQIKTKNATPKDYADLEKNYLDLLQTYGKHKGTIDLQVAYAHFLAFKQNNTQQATLFLKESLQQQLSTHQVAQVKLELADILVFQEKFNEALIYYTQIQRSLKNSTISQEARFKVAQTSYYKGDFKWAESQLKILKSSTSQLIANDALDLKLLISDNKYEDSTQTALKLYAKADLFAFQNKTDQAISLLYQILKAHKTETIIDQALYKQAQLFESKKQYQKAADNYKLIITNYKEEILADDALFYLAELYKEHLMLPEKAKELYEQIIFNHQDSIYFVEARKNYRMLRGDAIN
ncbi:tetratricopeptide repeat protein [Lacinutrix gracilariae]|uniref:Tetratricopeptide repeat protein n=1 Tax=Lacinutrix gracilariae TaxID=1747198 RepID=A0ABW5K149_9FLAO